MIVAATVTISFETVSDSFSERDEVRREERHRETGKRGTERLGKEITATLTTDSNGVVVDAR